MKNIREMHGYHYKDISFFPFENAFAYVSKIKFGMSIKTVGL